LIRESEYQEGDSRKPALGAGDPGAVVLEVGWSHGERRCGKPV